MFRFSVHIPFALCLAFFTLGHAISRASDVVPFASAGGVARAPRVLVFPDGRVIHGDIRMTANGYEVALSKNSGRTYIAPGMVWFTADSMDHAYEQYRERNPDRTADGYVLLASWCIQNGLYDDAREELKSALRMDPNHAAARLTAQELGKQLSKRQMPAVPRTDGGATIPEASPVVQETDLRKLFIARIQPMLMNGCGNADCHGRSSEREFRLMNVRSGHPAFARYTQLNYEMISRLINAKTPDQSPLLTAPRDTAHANLPNAPFRGSEGDRQFQVLAAWVKLAARYQEQQKQTPSETELADDARPSERVVRTASSMEAPDHSVVHAINFEPAESAKTNANVSTARTGSDPRDADQSRKGSGSPGRLDDILNQAIQSGTPDAFDPQDFNRQFSTQTNLSTPSNSNGPKR